MNVEIGTGAPIFLFWEYLFQIFSILSLQCVSFGASWKRIRNSLYESGPVSFHTRAKNKIKNFDFYCFVTLNYLLSLKTEVEVNVQLQAKKLIREKNLKAKILRQTPLKSTSSYKPQAPEWVATLCSFFSLGHTCS